MGGRIDPERVAINTARKGSRMRERIIQTSLLGRRDRLLKDIEASAAHRAVLEMRLKEAKLRARFEPDKLGEIRTQYDAAAQAHFRLVQEFEDVLNRLYHQTLTAPTTPDESIIGAIAA